MINKHYIKVPKLEYLKASKTTCIQGHQIKRYTISYTSIGKYYLSVNFECENQALKKTDKFVGIDLNTSELALFN